MPVIQRVLVAVIIMAMTIYIINLIRKNQLIMRYALLWFALSIVLLVCVLLPEGLDMIAVFFGFAVTSNMLFLIAFITLTVICISLSVIVSKQQKMIVLLVQEVSTIKMELEEENEGKECNS